MISLAAITAVFAALSLRLGYLMVVKGSEYASMAEDQWTNLVFIDAKRGRILDCNYNPLAVSGDVYRVDLDLNSIRNYISSYNVKHPESTISTESLSVKIAEALEMDAQTVLNRLKTKLENGEDAQSAILVRRIEKDKADNVKALRINGIIVSPDTLRYYPNNNLLSHVLGVTDSDSVGLTGIEYVYNDILEGTPGVRMVEADSYSNELPYTISEYTKPVDGKDVVLTVDENIQYFAEKAAAQALEDNKAEAVTIVVMNPNTGEVLAMANKPDYDANNPREGAETYENLQKIWRNRAVSDSFEPGSIFKVITAIAAMEEGIIKDDTTFSCSGSTNVSGTTINCWKTSGHGYQTLSDIIKNSCNMGFIQLGQMLGKETLQKYINLFGFGTITGIDLPGEAPGILKSLDTMADVDLATISFGQTNSLNNMQYMAAFNTIANGGTWITPHLLKEVVHTEGNTFVVDSVYDDAEKKTLISEENSGLLRTYLERVVTEGSATSAYIEGYHVAGKTGTAQKVVDGVYAQGKYISSFVGMAPADDPQITIMVTVNEPGTGNYYASQVAAPVAKQVLMDIFDYLSTKKEISDSELGGSLLKDVVIPEVRGISEQEASEALKKEGLDCTIEGQGSMVVAMSPTPGYSVKEGTKIKLTLGNDSNFSKEVVVPDLKGYSKQGAIDLLAKLKLQAVFTGEGMVINQSISVNEFVSAGTTLELTLEYKFKD